VRAYTRARFASVTFTGRFHVRGKKETAVSTPYNAAQAPAGNQREDFGLHASMRPAAS